MLVFCGFFNDFFQYLTHLKLIFLSRIHIFPVNFDHWECVACSEFGEVRGGDAGSKVLVPGEGG